MSLAEQYKDGTNLTARADLHAKHGTSPIGWFDWVARQIDWPAHAAVLEVGCGTGWLWSAVTTPITLTLTDQSAGMVAAATEHARALANIQLGDARVADAQDLPFADESFDVLVANHMLYHVPDRAKAIAEFARVLRPEGVLVAATNGRGHLRELFDVEREVFGERTVVAMADVFGRENGTAQLAACFAHVEWRTFADELHCTDPDDVVAYLASLGPSEPTPELRAAVRARFVNGVMRITKDTGLFVAAGR